MNDVHLALWRTARTCLSALAAADPDPTRYAQVLRGLDRLLIDECDAESAPNAIHVAFDAPVVAFETGHMAIGTMVALGLPWNALHPLLLDLTVAWQAEQARQQSGHAGDPIGSLWSTPLRYDHFFAYELARSHVKALASSVPATSPLDYWEVLQRIDDLHDPFARMAAQPVPTTSRAVMYAAARAVIKSLLQHDLNPLMISAAVKALDDSWNADTDHGTTDHPEHHAPVGGAS